MNQRTGTARAPEARHRSWLEQTVHELAAAAQGAGALRLAPGDVLLSRRQ